MSNFRATVGDWTIEKLPEVEIELASGFLFPGRDDEIRPGPLAVSIHTWVLRGGGRTILVDTGAGNGKHRPGFAFIDRLDTPYLTQLAALGVLPEAVDFVLFTHVHCDHVGWNTQLFDGEWRPTFPRARHLCLARELDFYAEPPTPGPSIDNALAYEDSMLPVRAAGLVDTVEADGREVLPGISFLSAPGHSVGHSVIRLAAGGDVALFVGDLMHHPLQVARPEISSVFCRDQAQARESRERILSLAAADNALVLPSHFTGSSAGRVLRSGDAFTWEPAQSPQ